MNSSTPNVSAAEGRSSFGVGGRLGSIGIVRMAVEIR
jgi:hypothetical protein